MKITFLALFTLFGGIVSAQNILLVNSLNQEPIESAHFSYGDQKGVSNASGAIRITYVKGAILEISHVNFGIQKFHSDAVAKIVKEGKIRIIPVYVSLQPTTVIARNLGKENQLALEVTGSDLMAHDAGVFLSQDASVSGIRKSGSYGFDPVFRGFKYDRINIVFDEGMSATAACPNRMDPPTSQIPMNMVSQVEILKGPHALRYGTGFGGTFHFKASPTKYAEELSPYGRVSGAYESNGHLFRTEALGGAMGKTYNVGVFGSYSEGQDYTDGNGEAVPSSFNRRSLGGNLAFKLSPQQELKASLTNNYATDVDFPALNMDLRKDDTWMASVGHKATFANGNIKQLHAALYGSFVDHTMDNFSRKNRPANAETLAQTQNFGGRSEAKIEMGNNFLYTGIDFRVEGADGTRTREILKGAMAGKVFKDKVWQNSMTSRSAMFGEFHFDIAKFYFVGSARLEYNQGNIRDLAPEYALANDNTSVQQFNPSLSLGATRDISPNIRMGLWLGRAQRSGGLSERFINYLPVDRDPYERVGNINLKSEANHQADFNLSWTSEKTKIGTNVFASYISNYITAEIDSTLKPKMMTAPGVKQYANLNEAFLTGFELSWNQQWPFSLYSNAGVAYTYGQDVGAKAPLPEIAPMDFRFTLGAQYFQKKWVPELTLRHVMAQNKFSESFGESATPAFTLLDFRMSYTLSKHFYVHVSVDNIFDTAYYEHLSRSVQGDKDQPIYARGRSFMASVVLKL